MTTTFHGDARAAAESDAALWSGRDRPRRRHRMPGVWLLVAVLAASTVLLGLAQLRPEPVRSLGGEPGGGHIVPARSGPGSGSEAGGAAAGSQAPEAAEPPAEEPPAGEPPAPLPPQVMVTPDPLDLPPNTYGGKFVVANAGDGILSWTASSKPAVTLSQPAGDLAGGGQQVVSFTVDPTSLGSGAFSFEIKVSGNGGTTYVAVHGFKPFGLKL